MTARRVALITGAAGDIGRAVAVALATDGIAVALADLPAASQRLNETAEQCRSAGAPAAIAVGFDVTEPGDVVDAVRRISSEAGVPTLVFNNAGYQGEFANLLDYPLADVGRVLDVNVTGVFAVLQATAAAMRDAGLPGAVVNTASMAGVGGAPNMAAYSASKAAVIGLTRSAAKDLAPLGIRVNAVSPGFIGPGVMWDRQVNLQASIPSPYFADSNEEVAAQMVGSVPLGRYGSLDEVASTVQFLLSDASSFMTGTNLEIAGGGH